MGDPSKCPEKRVPDWATCKQDSLGLSSAQIEKPCFPQARASQWHKPYSHLGAFIHPVFRPFFLSFIFLPLSVSRFHFSFCFLIALSVVLSVTLGCGKEGHVVAGVSVEEQNDTTDPSSLSNEQHANGVQGSAKGSCLSTGSSSTLQFSTSWDFSLQ